jgi:transcriptional regulator with XRE-family HTH domain
VRDAVLISRARLAAARGNQLREARERAGLTQSDVARAIGVSPAAVSRWEAGKRRPSAATAARLGRLLERLERAQAGGRPRKRGAAG